MKIDVEESPFGDGGAMLIAVEGELDLASCERLKPAADQAVFGRRPLVLDLSQCSFLDSSALRLILQIYKGLADGEPPPTPMAIVIGDSETRRLFSLTAIDKTIPMFRAREEARAWLEGETAGRGEAASAS